MTERPILFSDEMVRAILDGRKTQTRRLVTPGTAVSPSAHLHDLVFADAWVDPGPSPAGNPGPYLKAPDVAEGAVHRVYSRIWSGDLLYVRECHQVATGKAWDGRAAVRYRADGALLAVEDDMSNTAPRGMSMCGRWRPSIHMPRWASRLLLRVTDVRVERVQDITEADARAEGYNCRGYAESCDFVEKARPWFAALWDSLAQPGSTWAENPWVWVVSFAVEEKPRG